MRVISEDPREQLFHAESFYGASLSGSLSVASFNPHGVFHSELKHKWTVQRKGIKDLSSSIEW